MNKRQEQLFPQLTNRMEATLANAEWMIKLKDGTEMEGRLAMATLEFLTLERSSQTVEELYRVAKGEIEPSKELREQYDLAGFRDSGEMQPSLKTILLNAVELDESGVRLVSPFSDDSWTQHVVNTMRENEPIHLQRFLDKLRDFHDKGGREPSL